MFHVTGLAQLQMVDFSWCMLGLMDRKGHKLLRYAICNEVSKRVPRNDELIRSKYNRDTNKSTAYPNQEWNSYEEGKSELALCELNLSETWLIGTKILQHISSE